jgi:AraC-like DNA-binding protein
MNNSLYEYIDPITSPYEAFVVDTKFAELPVPTHWHYYVELLYILEGEVDVTINGRVLTAETGSVVLFPPKSVHGIDFASGCTKTKYDVIKFDPANLPTSKLDETDIRTILHGLDNTGASLLISPKDLSQWKMRSLFESIIKENQSRDYAYSLMISSDLLKILGYFVRIWKKEGLTPSGKGVHPSYELHFDMISEYIDSHYFEPLTVEKLATMCNVSHATFSRNFQKRFGMSCKEYITSTRINIAENMLHFSNYDIAFIAQEVGFTDSSYFIRCYKKLKGITPKQVRKLSEDRKQIVS